MKGPERVGFSVFLGLVLGIVLLWPGDASAAILDWSIFIAEQGETANTVVTINGTNCSGLGQLCNGAFVATTPEGSDIKVAGFTTSPPILEENRTFYLIEEIGSTTEGTISDRIFVTVTTTGALEVTFLSGPAAAEASLGSRPAGCDANSNPLTTGRCIDEPPLGGFVTLINNETIHGTSLFLKAQSEPVPEPGTLLLLGSGLAGVGMLWGRRRQR